MSSFLGVSKNFSSIFWFRLFICILELVSIEYQARGTAHVHGCVHLKSDPKCTLMGEKILDGHVSERELVVEGFIVLALVYIDKTISRKMSGLLTNSYRMSCVLNFIVPYHIKK